MDNCDAIRSGRCEPNSASAVDKFDDTVCLLMIPSFPKRSG
jgi:hypothetical protein